MNIYKINFKFKYFNPRYLESLSYLKLFLYNFLNNCFSFKICNFNQIVS